MFASRKHLVVLWEFLIFLAIYVRPGRSGVPLEGLQRTKIVGGKTAERAEFPFQILIRDETRIFCGGSILDKSSILTAAHCFYGLKAGDYKSLTIVAGDHNWQEEEGTEQRRGIGSVHIHEKYTAISGINDLAIIQLDLPLQFSRVVQPVLLPAPDYEASGEAVVTGWGVLRFGGSQPNVLKKVTVPIVAREDCIKAYEGAQVLVSIYMLCAGDVVRGGVDSCQGDSGGPLSVRLSNGSSMLIGVVSTGIGCGDKEYPGIYMKVSKYLSWIIETRSNFTTLVSVCSESEKISRSQTKALTLSKSGLIKIPDLPSASSFLFEYKPAVEESQVSTKKPLLWTLDNVHKNGEYYVFTCRVTLLCGNSRDTVSVLNGNFGDDGFVMSATELVKNSNSFLSGQDYSRKLYLSYTSANGLLQQGFLVLIDISEIIPGNYGTNFLYTNGVSSGSLTYGPTKAWDKFSIVVVGNPILETNTTFTVESASTKLTTCDSFDILNVYEILPRGTPQRFDCLCGNVTSPISFTSQFSILAVSFSDDNGGYAFQLSWK